jgi:hypothetical protein
LGAGAGIDPDIGSNNIYIGDGGLAGDTNLIAIGNITATGTPYEAFYVGGVVNVEIPMASAVPLYIDSATGQLGTVLVDAKGNHTPAPVSRGKRAQPQAKLKEFQKQQKRIAELESTVARLAATVKDQATN